MASEVHNDDSASSVGDGEMFLKAARLGDTDKLQFYIDNNSVDVNYKGQSRAFLDSTALHLASYFGHLPAVKLLVKNGACVNVQNGAGDTPLHKATFTSRMNVVLELLRSNADVRIIDGNGRRAVDISRSEDISEALHASERRLEYEAEQTLLRVASEGDVALLKLLLGSDKPPRLGCCDDLGNTALHNAAYRGHADVIVLLFQHGIDPTIPNMEGKTALDLAATPKIRALLDVKPIKAFQRQVQRFEGQLLKKSRFFGYQLCWVVLDQGILSWFATKADAAQRRKHLGFKHLADADIAMKPDDDRMIRILFTDYTVHLWSIPKGPNVAVDRERWITQLKEHRVHGTREVRPMNSRNGRVLNHADENADRNPMVGIDDSFGRADAYRLVLERQLQEVRQLVERTYGPSSTQGYHAEVQVRFDQLLATSRDMCAALGNTVALMRQQEEVRRVQLGEERERCRLLEESMQALAQEHHALEVSLGRPTTPMSVADETFFDAVSNFGSDNEDKADDEFFETESQMSSPHIDNDVVTALAASAVELSGVDKWDDDGYRTCLPHKMTPRGEISLWMFLKQCIGKDLSRITMPVLFNEPLSFTQRVVESLTYSHLLDKAALCDDPVVRIQYVTAFAVSHYACDVSRTSKFFNPLLGETYELIREDLGFRVVCEQVSHHPPITAMYCEGRDYVISFSIQPKIRFWGKGVEVHPVGRVTLELKKYEEVYTWGLISTCVHNIIVGKVWVEHFGTLDIRNHSNNLCAHLNFKSCGWFGRDLHVIEGTIQSASKETLWCLAGKWPEEIVAYLPTSNKDKGRGSSLSGSESGLTSAAAQAVPVDSLAEPAVGAPKSILRRRSHNSAESQPDGPRRLWRADPMPPSHQDYYGMTRFSYCLNELKPEVHRVLPPTDSRYRPDVRLLEEGRSDEAAIEKNRLEEKQRHARRMREQAKEEWETRWFKEGTSRYTGAKEWQFTGRYWSREDYATCPDIF